MKMPVLFQKDDDMRRIFRAIPALITVFAVFFMFSVPAAAASLNGISTSVTEAASGDRFTVYVDIPRSANADTLSVRVEYDPAVFNIISWRADVPNAVSNSGEGFFVVTSANAQRAIDLSRGLRFYAEAEVRRDAPTGRYDFRLVTASVSYVKDNGYEFVELWSPADRNAAVRINGNGSGPIFTTTTKREEVTQRTTSRTDDTPDEIEEVYDPDDETVDPPDEEDSIYDDEDDPDDWYEEPFDEEPVDEEPTESDMPETARDVKITLDSQLSGLSDGKIRLSTKSYFFTEDTVVELRNTDPYGADAQHAVANLLLESHDRYTFDITLRGTETGSLISTLGSGYIELAIPLPERMKTSPDALRVYHIADGFPRLIASSITSEDGTAKICFRANSFSPYMIIDTVNEYYPEPEIISGNSTGGNGGRPINPATGVAAAVIIPSAMIGCVVLAKKSKKRKRAKKYQGGEDDEETQ